MSSVSYAITVCSEVLELERLLDSLNYFVLPQDEIVILQDVSKGDEVADRVQKVIRDHNLLNSTFTGNFSGNFADWKNKLNAFCEKDFIFQIDADEFLGENFRYLPVLLEANRDVDLFLVPRVNTVDGLTQEDISRWRWRVDDKGRVNWPDYQTRIYRNDPKIKWEGKVHERITGHKKWTKLPDGLYLIHPKTIQKQREQNALYSQMTYGK